MKKFDERAFKSEMKKTNSVFHLIDYLNESDRLLDWTSADRLVTHNRKYRFVNEEHYPSVYFEKMDYEEGDHGLFILEKDDAFLLISDQGKIGKLIYKEDREKPVFVQEKNKEHALGYLMKSIQREQRRMTQSDPAEVIKADLKRRKRNQKNHIDSKIINLKQLDDLPEDFDEMLQYLYDWADNYKEFKTALSVGDASIFGCRPLERIQRATYALDEPQERTDEEIVIYRGLPTGMVIEEGDWVSTDEDYARSHERNSKDAITISEVVYADEVYDSGSPDEQVYVPRGTWGNAECLRDVWDSMNEENKPAAPEALKERTIKEIEAEKSGSSLNY